MINLALCVFLIILTMLPTDSHAATKIFLHDAASKLGTIATAGVGYGCSNGTNNTVYRLANTTQGTAAVTKTWKPTATAPPCRPQTQITAGGDYLIWITPPIASAITISGNINGQFYCSQSANGTNSGYRFKLYRWSAAVGGIVSTLHTSAYNATECTAASSGTAKTNTAAAPTSTNFSIGDRIVISVEVGAVGGAWGGNGTRTISFIYDGPNAASGNTWVNFVDTITFAADSAVMIPQVQ